MLQPVIIAGGSGSRLWPVSRHQRPKQFLTLTGQHSMVQHTLQRLNGLRAAAPIVVCNEEHRFLAAEQLRQIEVDDATLVLEPEGRNTAPAIAVAALHALESGDPLLLVLAADQVITDVAAFQAAVGVATPLAEAGKLVTFGVPARTPETGYGYIRKGDSLSNSVFTIDAFVEKPDLETAQSYVESQNYFWNSGMFMFRASRLIEELGKYRPEVLQACEAALAGKHRDLDFLRLDDAAFCAAESVSVDVAVMENTRDGVVIPLDAGWNDVGSWVALWEVSEKDLSGNAFRGDVLQSGSSNNLAFSDHRLVTLVGVENLVVVETKDAVLVAKQDRVQDVRSIVDDLRRKGRKEHINHREVYRPWGHYDSVDNGDRDQVKRITVNPGAKLSVQMHHHRAEHWVVVRGTARVHRGDEVIMLTENQSTYIPLGEVHSLENPGKIPLEIIEVQSGSYLGEDDIVRLDDVYGRT